MNATTVTVVLKSVQATLVQPSRSKRGIGNDWTISTDLVGWAAITRFVDGSGKPVLRPTPREFTFTTSGARAAKKTVDLDFGTVIFSDREPCETINVRFQADLNEPDPVFEDFGSVAADLQIDLAPLGTVPRTVIGRVAARGGDESGVMEFTFNLEITMAEVDLTPRLAVPDDGPGPGEFIPFRGKGVELRTVQPLQPGLALSYVDPETRIRLAQILNTINFNFRIVRETLIDLLEALTIDNYLPESLRIGPLTQIQAELSKQLQETLNSIDLSDFPTGTASMTVDVTAATFLPMGLGASVVKKAITNTIASIPVVGAQLKDTLAPTVDPVVEKLLAPALVAINLLYRNIGNLIASVSLLDTLEPRAVLAPKPTVVQIYPFEVRVRRFDSGDVGRNVTIRVRDNTRITAVNTPVALVDHTVDVVAGGQGMRIAEGRGELTVALPADGRIEGSYILTGNYGNVTIGALFVDDNDQALFAEDITIVHRGVFEDELRRQEQKRYADEVAVINSLLTAVNVGILGQVVPAIDASLRILQRTISLVEAIPLAGDVIANVLNLIISALKELLFLEVIKARGSVEDFKSSYLAVNDAVGRNNLRNAEQFPEQNVMREVLR